ncbi:MAG: Flp pilus assembly complex ATPase component TadA [Betaproteobacteria bacterium]|nr:Flp pilus assembly complex ATPase component TadA [Betaproteobacteria bacterium]
MPVMRLGEALVEMGMLTVTQLEDALTHQRENRSKLLGAILVEMGFISQDQLRHALAVKLGFPVVDISRFPVDANALRQVPARLAGRLKLLPILLSDTMLVVALDDPLHSERLNQVRFLTQNKVVPVIAVGESIDKAIERWYHKLGMDTLEAAPESSKTDLCFDDALNFLPNAARTDIAELASALDAERPTGDEEDNHIQEADNTLVRLVNTMILDAYKQGISDIHIESYPGKQKMRIRFRRDGTLQPYLELPASYRKAVIARIKIMADLDISERRKPQDGKIDFARFGPARIELRVATIPTNAGLEDAVMRILASARPVPLEELGLSDYNRDNLKRIMTKSYGLFLICGPTGSGKTTTLHSAMSYINVPERKIWTAEDPVEITQPGLRQVQVNPKIGWTFAGALRAFLRADPDVIMVGEMRDTETARIGVEASLTGHLVLSTLHTNSAPESVTRLLDMGLDPFNFADALLGVLAQRLAKRLCTKCRAEHVASDAELDELLSEYLFNMPPNAPIHRDEVLAEWKRRHAREGGHLYLYASEGCSECGGTGYRGRLGLHELLASSLEIKRLVQTRAPVEDIQRTALVQGMRTLKQDGIEKTLQGHTDLAQVRAVTN